MQINMSEEESKAVLRLAARVRGHMGGIVKSVNQQQARRRNGKMGWKRKLSSRAA